MLSEFREALLKILPALEMHEVDFIVIGGAAVNIHGHPRISGAYTEAKFAVDLDFWFNPTISNYHNLLKALRELGIDIMSFEERVFDPKKTFIKLPYESFHIDFLSQVSGLDNYRDCKKNCLVARFDDHEIKILSYDDLLKSKMAVSRQIDKDDIEELKKKKGQRKS